MLKKKIIPVFLASVLTVSGTTGFVTEAFSENVYAAEEVHTERLADFGEAIQIFTDAGQEYMTDNFGSYLSDGEYYEGFMKFADLCEEFIIQAQSGEPYDVENLPEETIPFYMIFLISLVVGFVIALIVTGVMRSRMKTVHMKPDAADYMKDGSLHINRSRDIFLYHQVTRTAKPKEESSGGGGSSTHTSSSGETHGGSSGSF